MRITSEQASARVRAGLGRHAQDALEATVVLEAWGGLVSRTALSLSRGGVDSTLPARPRAASARPRGQVTSVSTREALGLIATLLATTAWVAPLMNALGTNATARAWQIALPISLALQWLLRRRHLTGPDGLSRLRADMPVVATAGVLCLLVPFALLLAPVFSLPMALVVTWVGGLLIVVRGWGIAYAVSLAMATWAIRLGVNVVVDVIAVVLLTFVAVAAALLTSPEPQGRPTPWRRSLPAGLIGGLLAMLIVIDPSVEWSSNSPFPVIALVPSLLGSLWAGHHLNRIWTVLLGALASTSLLDRSSRHTWRVFSGIVLGAVGRLVLGTVLASVVTFLLLRHSAASESGLIRLLLGLGAFGVIGFLAALLESFSRLAGALGMTVVALAAAGWTLFGPFDVLPGSVLVVAAAAAVLAAIEPVVRLVRQPDRTLATLF